jgi:hypothetical protein
VFDEMRMRSIVRANSEYDDERKQDAFVDVDDESFIPAFQIVLEIIPQ